MAIGKMRKPHSVIFVQSITAVPDPDKRLKRRYEFSGIMTNDSSNPTENLSAAGNFERKGAITCVKDRRRGKFWREYPPGDFLRSETALSAQAGRVFYFFTTPCTNVIYIKQKASAVVR